MRTQESVNWSKETDQELLDRHRNGNVIGINGATYWVRMDTLRDVLKKRNLI